MISTAMNDAAILAKPSRRPAKATCEDRLLTKTHEELAAAKQLLVENESRAKRAKRKLARDNAKRAAELVKMTIKSIKHHEEPRSCWLRRRSEVRGTETVAMPQRRTERSKKVT
jgi:hypothetical protein